MFQDQKIIINFLLLVQIKVHWKLVNINNNNFTFFGPCKSSLVPLNIRRNKSNSFFCNTHHPSSSQTLRITTPAKRHREHKAVSVGYLTSNHDSDRNTPIPSISPGPDYLTSKQRQEESVLVGLLLARQLKGKDRKYKARLWVCCDVSLCWSDGVSDMRLNCIVRGFVIQGWVLTISLLNFAIVAYL